MSPIKYDTNSRIGEVDAAISLRGTLSRHAAFNLFNRFSARAGGRRRSAAGPTNDATRRVRLFFFCIFSFGISVPVGENCACRPNNASTHEATDAASPLTLSLVSRSPTRVGSVNHAKGRKPHPLLTKLMCVSSRMTPPSVIFPHNSPTSPADQALAKLQSEQKKHNNQRHPPLRLTNCVPRSHPPTSSELRARRPFTPCTLSIQGIFCSRRAIHPPNVLFFPSTPILFSHIFSSLFLLFWHRHKTK